MCFVDVFDKGSGGAKFLVENGCTISGHFDATVYRGDSHHFDSNMDSLNLTYKLDPFPGFASEDMVDRSFDIPPGMEITFHIIDCHSTSNSTWDRLKLNYEIIGRWLSGLGVNVELHIDYDQRQVGASCGIVASSFVTSARRDRRCLARGAQESAAQRTAVSLDTIKTANTILAGSHGVPHSFSATTKTAFLFESAVNKLGRHFMDENPPLGYDESFVTWPFTCCTMDQMLVNTAAAMRKAVDHNTPGESYFVSNSEGTSISGYHWFGAVLQISVGGSFEDVMDLGGADD